MNIIAPCKDCPDRNGACHAVCEKYLTWRKRRDKLLEKAKQDKALDAALAAMARN